MVAKIKASSPLPNSHQVLFQEQQQILFNGNEVSNSQKLSAIGVKDDDSLTITVSKKGVGAGVVASSGSANNLSFNTDGSSINPSAFQQHFRRDSNLMAQLFLAKKFLVFVTGQQLEHLNWILKELHFKKSLMNFWGYFCKLGFYCAFQ